MEFVDHFSMFCTYRSCLGTRIKTMHLSETLTMSLIIFESWMVHYLGLINLFKPFCFFQENVGRPHLAKLHIIKS